MNYRFWRNSAVAALAIGLVVVMVSSFAGETRMLAQLLLSLPV